MMAFLDIRFPDGISYNAQGGPEFATDVVIVNSGAESRNQNWSQPRRVFEVSHAARMPADYKALQSFFHAVRGRADSFRFKDWTDYTAITGEGVFQEITNTTFQCYKKYTSGSVTFYRKITKPIAPIVVTGGTGVSVNYSTGLVTVSSSVPTAWTGEFDCHARFDTDEMRGEIVSRSGNNIIIGWNSIPIVELKE
jgi:uncharacterized protein (TIGR02217 family)